MDWRALVMKFYPLFHAIFRERTEQHALPSEASHSPVHAVFLSCDIIVCTDSLSQTGLTPTLAILRQPILLSECAPFHSFGDYHDENQKFSSASEHT